MFEIYYNNDKFSIKFSFKQAFKEPREPIFLQSLIAHCQTLPLLSATIQFKLWNNHFVFKGTLTLDRFVAEAVIGVLLFLFFPLLVVQVREQVSLMFLLLMSLHIVLFEPWGVWWFQHLKSVCVIGENITKIIGPCWNISFSIIELLRLLDLSRLSYHILKLDLNRVALAYILFLSILNLHHSIERIVLIGSWGHNSSPLAICAYHLWALGGVIISTHSFLGPK